VKKKLFWFLKIHSAFYLAVLVALGGGYFVSLGLWKWFGVVRGVSSAGTLLDRIVFGLAVSAVSSGILYGISWFFVVRRVQEMLDDKRPMTGFSRWRSLTDIGMIMHKLRHIAHRYLAAEENLSTLFSASKMLTSQLELQEIYNRVLDLVWRRSDRQPCVLWWMGEDGYLRIKDFRNFPLELVRRLRLLASKTSVGRCYSSRQWVVVQDLKTVSDFLTAEEARSLDVSECVHLPLQIDDKTIGVMTAFSRQRGFFNDEQVRMMSSLMEYISLATKNAQMYGEMQAFNRRLEGEVAATTQELTQTNIRLIQRVRELKALYDVAVVAATSPKVEDSLQKIQGHIGDLLNIEKSGVLLWDEKNTRFSPAMPFLGMEEARVKEFFLTEEMLKDKKQTLLGGNSVILSYEEVQRLFPGQNLKTVLLTPLRTGGQLMGLFAAANKVFGSFTDEDVRILSLFTQNVSEIVRNLQLREERERHMGDQVTLQKVATSITAEPKLGPTLSKIAKITAESLGAEVCAFLLWDDVTNELVTQHGAFGLPTDNPALLYRVSVDHPHYSSARVFRTGEPYMSPDVQQDDHVYLHYANLWKIRSLLVMPLKLDKKCIGVMRIGHSQPRRFVPEHTRLASLIADQAAVIVQNAKLYQKIQENVRELQRLNRVKTEFISMVSHELRTPITAIKGFVTVVLNNDAGPLNQQQERFLRIANQSIDRLTLLITDLLDISRIEAGKIEIYPIALSLNETLQHSIRDHLPSAQEKEIKLELQLATVLPEVKADPNRIRQVIDNLLSNAIKFTPEKGTVVLSAQDCGDYVMVSVKDSGIGLAESEHEKVFEKFYQVDSSLTRTSRGVGLGLAISRSIVELHGGRIWVESESGKGSEFKVILPRIRKHEEVPALVPAGKKE